MLEDLPDTLERAAATAVLELQATLERAEANAMLELRTTLERAEANTVLSPRLQKKPHDLVIVARASSGVLPFSSSVLGFAPQSKRSFTNAA